VAKTPQLTAHIRQYGSAELQKVFRISNRQIQVWVDSCLISAAVISRCRRFTFDQAVEIGLVSDLRSKGVHLQQASEIIESYRLHLRRHKTYDIFILTDGRSSSFLHSSDEVIRELTRKRAGMLLVDVYSIVCRIELFHSGQQPHHT